MLNIVVFQVCGMYRAHVYCQVFCIATQPVNPKAQNCFQVLKWINPKLQNCCQVLKWINPKLQNCCQVLKWINPKLQNCFREAQPVKFLHKLQFIIYLGLSDLS